MNRLLIIDSCDDCPFFDNEYYGFEETCKKLDRVITSDTGMYTHDIPDDCPLNETDGLVTNDR